MAKRKKVHKGHKVYPSKIKEELKKTPFFRRWWIISLEVITFLSILTLYEYFKQKITPDSVKFVNETQITGQLKPPEIKIPNSSYTILDIPQSFKISTLKSIGPHISGISIKDFSERKYIIMVIGGLHFKCPTEDLLKGIRPYEATFKPCGGATLDVGVKDNRLYVSLRFRSFPDGALIGNMEFNHWTLFRKNLISYKADDERLEVKDNQGYIVLSVRYLVDSGNEGIVAISGYLFEKPNLVILPNNNYGQPIVLTVCHYITNQPSIDSLQKEISTITSVF